MSISEGLEYETYYQIDEKIVDGIRINEPIAKGSTAASFGLRPGDVLYKIEGNLMAFEEVELLGEFAEPGTKLRAEIIRGTTLYSNTIGTASVIDRNGESQQQTVLGAAYTRVKYVKVTRVYRPAKEQAFEVGYDFEFDYAIKETIERKRRRNALAGVAAVFATAFGLSYAFSRRASASEQRPRRWRSLRSSARMSIDPDCREQLEVLGAQRMGALNDLIEMSTDEGFRTSELLAWIEVPNACLGAYTDEEFEVDVWRAALSDGLSASDVFRVFQKHNLNTSSNLWFAAPAQ